MRKDEETEGRKRRREEEERGGKRRGEEERGGGMEGLSSSHFVCLPVAIFHLAAAPSSWSFQAVETVNICLRSPGRQGAGRPRQEAGGASAQNHTPSKESKDRNEPRPGGQIENPGGVAGACWDLPGLSNPLSVFTRPGALILRARFFFPPNK